MSTDWGTLLSCKKSLKTVTEFAHGEMSGRDFYSRFANTEGGGIVRNLLRDHGVVYSKRLARKALSRRGA
ncbi:TPA: hypothetical protein HA278_07405 [Candidatus Woesearchaeota archaeon]|nr:hypothetical protein [Candidatus Woesearchaeota archaeon]|tara:strand:- start:922 stop:1131 length:210 start_codon:yes stop_codon:yes gene_type:complete